MHFQVDRIFWIGEQPRKGSQLVKILSLNEVRDIEEGKGSCTKIKLVKKKKNVGNLRDDKKGLKATLAYRIHYTKESLWRQKEEGSQT